MTKNQKQQLIHHKPLFFEVLDVMHSHIAVTTVHSVNPGTFIIINVVALDCAPGKSLLYFTWPYVSAITHAMEESMSDTPPPCVRK